MKKYKNIVWDWNGTLLDDLNISVKAINLMLKKRELSELTIEQYRDIFGFPVRKYYEAVGFDFKRDDWDEVSQEFIDSYDNLSKGVELTRGVNIVIDTIKSGGIRQYVLSALKEDLLNEMLKRLGIINYFYGVCGTTNIYGDGKSGRGREMVASYPIVPNETLMIGDTLHDAEVAEGLGFDFCLYSGGHNSTDRLKARGQTITVIEDILNLI